MLKTFGMRVCTIYTKGLISVNFFTKYCGQKLLAAFHKKDMVHMIFFFLQNYLLKMEIHPL